MHEDHPKCGQQLLLEGATIFREAWWALYLSFYVLFKLTTINTKKKIRNPFSLKEKKVTNVTFKTKIIFLMGRITVILYSQDENALSYIRGSQMEVP